MDDLLVEVVRVAHQDLRERYTRLALSVAQMLEPDEQIRAACIGAVDVEGIPVVMAATTRRLVGVGLKHWLMNVPYSAVEAVGRGEGRTRTNDVGVLVISGVRIRTTSPGPLLQRFLAAVRQGIDEDAAGIWPAEGVLGLGQISVMGGAGVWRGAMRTHGRQPDTVPAGLLIEQGVTQFLADPAEWQIQARVVQRQE